MTHTIPNWFFCFLFCTFCIACGLLLGQIIRFAVAYLQQKDHTPLVWIVEFDSYAGWIRVAEYPTSAQAYACTLKRGAVCCLSSPRGTLPRMTEIKLAASLAALLAGDRFRCLRTWVAWPGACRVLRLGRVLPVLGEVAVMLTDAHKFNTGSNPFLGYASATPAQDLRAAAPTQMQLAVQAGQVVQQLYVITLKRATQRRGAGLHIKPDFQPRIQFSASQLETASGCQYAWALRYIIGLKKPEPALETAEDEQRELARLPTLAKRDRSLTFGKLLHKRLERHYRGEAVDWTDDVGQRALTGLQYLPGLDEPRRIESAISLAKDSVIGGVDLPFVGFIDLETLRPRPTTTRPPGTSGG
jgi:hypothetical protein